MADLNEIVDTLSSLTVMEAANLAKMLEEKWGVSAAAPVAVAAAAGGGGAAAEAVEEKTEFDVVLSAVGEKKIEVVLHGAHNPHAGKVLAETWRQQFGETKGARNKHVGHGLDARVEVAHDRVVVPAGILDRVLKSLERSMEVLVVLAGLQVRIVFGEGKHRPQLSRQGVLGVTGRTRPAAGGRLSARARIGDVLQGLRLVRGIGLHRVNQIADQIMPPLELHVDVRPGGRRAVLETDEAIKKNDHHDDDRTRREKPPPHDCRIAEFSHTATVMTADDVLCAR